MKYFINKQKLLMALLLVFFYSSCSDEFMDRPPEDALVVDNFYRSADQVKAATAALYGFPWFTINDKALWCIGDAMAGNLYTTDGDIGQFFVLGVGQNNPHLFEAWESLYRVVAYSNSVLVNVAENAAADIDRAIVNTALAEARFMRATAYFYLVRIFGEVPLIEDHRNHVLDPKIPKHHKDDVYQFIVRDLKIATSDLPLVTSGRDAGRVTQWAAKGMLAKVYLTMKDYNSARDYAADVINNSGLDLLPNFDDLFKTSNNNNQESLFALQWMACVDWGTQNTNQAYWARNGTLTGVGDGWGGWTGPTIDLQMDFEPGDRRRKATYMQHGDFYPELRSSAGGYHYELMNEAENRSPVNASVKKYVVGTPADNDGMVCNMSNGLNTYMMRLSDVYLTHAEAILGSQASTSDGQALESFNRVRARAGLPTKNSITFLDILKERRTEFAFESQYWYDLMRYFDRDQSAAVEMINNMDKGTFVLRPDWDGPENVPEAYEVNTNTYSFSTNRRYLPIPSRDVDQNPLLSPNEPAVPFIFSD